jgi:hypothetical protein
MTSQSGAAHFSPDNTVITPVRRAVQNKQDVLLTLDGVGQVLVRGALGECLAGPMNNLMKFCTVPVSHIRVAVLETDEATRQAAGQTGRNIDELLWTAAFHLSQGHLMEGCNTFDVVQFRHWPNLSRLPHTPNSMRIVAMLTRHPTSIALAHRLLKIEAKELYQVYSAARCAGLVRVVNGAVPEPVLKPHRNQTLLSSLMSKIVGL